MADETAPTSDVEKIVANISANVTASIEAIAKGSQVVPQLQLVNEKLDKLIKVSEPSLRDKATAFMSAGKDTVSKATPTTQKPAASGGQTKVSEGLKGLGAAGAGLGAFFLGLAGAEAIMSKFGSGDNLKKLLINLGQGLDGLSDRSMIALAAAMGAGAALGAVPGLSSAGAGMGIAWVGVGIGAFFGGLALGDKLLSWMDTDMSALQKATKGFNAAVGELDQKTMTALATLMGTGAIMGTVFGPYKGGLGVAAGIGAVGLGIAAFFGGLALGDAALNWMDTDMSALKKAVKGMNEALAEMDADTMKVVGGLLAVGGATGALFGPTKAAGAAVGMGAIGIGIGAFFAGLGAADAALTFLDTNGTKLKQQVQVLVDCLNILGEGEDNLKIVGGLLAAGAGAGALFGPKKVGKAAVGMGVIGLGIGSFFTGLALPGAIGTWININGDALQEQIEALAGGLSALGADPKGLAVVGGLLTAGGAAGALFGPKKVGKAAIGMGVLGLGIGSFFTGLAIPGAIGEWIDVNGKALKNQMTNLAEGLSAFSGAQLAGLTGLFATGAIFGAVPGGLLIAGKAAVGAAAIGLAIGGFFSGIAVGGKIADLVGADGSSLKKILTNFAEGLQAFDKVDGKNFANVGKALPALSLGLIGFLGAEGLQKIMDTGKEVMEFFFGADQGPKKKTIIERLVESLDPLSQIDTSKLDAFNRVIDSLERFIGLDLSGQNQEMIRFGRNFPVAVKYINAALYGGQAHPQDGKIEKGLIANKDDWAIAANAMKELSNSTVVAPGGAGVAAGATKTQMIDQVALQAGAVTMTTPSVIVNVPEQAGAGAEQGPNSTTLISGTGTAGVDTANKFYFGNYQGR